MKSIIHPIHPFPARMAPEIALEEAAGLPAASVILDPMTGSGTVMRVISEQGHTGLAYDMDPLAVLMTRVWTTPIDIQTLNDAAEAIIKEATVLNDDMVNLPWIDDNDETKAFINFWFGEEQQRDLRKLVFALKSRDGGIADALRIAFSRLIITKDRGASLARDVSHSRPHRVRTKNDFSVIDEFRRSVSLVASRLKNQPPPGNVTVSQGDARHLAGVESSTVDAIITSPPYLNAIDYMRGHKLSLVWLGHPVSDLRQIRQESIGAERGLDIDTDSVIKTVHQEMPLLATLPSAKQRMANRYILDMYNMNKEFARVLKPGGKAVLVVGNSCVRGVFVENARIASLTAQHHGFVLHKRRERELPPNKRYLPPPSGGEGSTLEKRMRTEVVLTLVRP